MPADTPFLYALATAEPTADRWRYSGRTPPLEGFTASAVAGTTAHWVFEDLSGASVAYGAFYDYDPDDGIGYVAVVVTPEHWQTLTSFSAMYILVDYIFDHWDVRSLYGESAESSYETFESGAGRWFDERGRLREHLYRAGRFQDVIVLEIDRERFRARGQRYSRIVYRDDAESRPPAR